MHRSGKNTDFVKSTNHREEQTSITSVYNKPRWWFGGLSSALVAFIAAPFDIVKTHMQTQKRKKTSWMTARNVIQARGYIGFYDGLSAALLRQMTATSIRFSIYESGKAHQLSDNIYKKIILASFAGVVGATVGIPLDLINVRMQNDMKSKPEERRNYKHVFDGLVRIPREESYRALYKGGCVAILKSAVGTIGQIAMYDQVKEVLCKHYKFDDGFRLHFTSSVLSSIIACVISQPFDVLKTVLMNSRPGEFNSSYDAIVYMMRFGPTGIFRGILPNLARKGPCTVLLYLIYEQMRINFGYLTETDSSNKECE